MENKPAKTPRTALDRDAWIKGAIAILAEHGAERLRVEVLAKRLSVTKGSFYWHFKDRRDLQDAVLEFWKKGRISDIRKQTQAVPRGEGAARDGARRDAQAAAVVEHVDGGRLACALRLFLACGIKEEEAQARSLMLYAYVFGVSLMRCGGFTDNIESLKAWIAEHIAR